MLAGTVILLCRYNWLYFFNFMRFSWNNFFILLDFLEILTIISARYIK